MKKFLLVAAMAMVSMVASAQFSVTPKVGLNIASVTSSEMNAKIGFVAGAEAGYAVSEKFGVTAGLLYSGQGAKEDKHSTGLHYMNIPVLANVNVWKGLSVKAGIQPGFLLAANDSYDGESVDIKEGCNTFDFAIPVGLSYEVSNIVIDARYNIGVTNIIKNADKGTNSVFQLTVGYKFGL